MKHKSYKLSTINLVMNVREFREYFAKNEKFIRSQANYHRDLPSPDEEDR